MKSSNVIKASGFFLYRELPEDYEEWDELTLLNHVGVHRADIVCRQATAKYIWENILTLARAFEKHEPTPDS